MNVASPPLAEAGEPFVKPRRRLLRLDVWPLALPGLILLFAALIAPLAWFLAGSIAELGSSEEIGKEVLAVLTDPSVLSAASFTAFVSVVVTAICALLAYPMAAVLIRARGLLFNVLIGAIIVPYFTSTIVRTYAWMVLLGRGGVVNQTLLNIGAIEAPLQLMYTQGAVILGMTYVLLPYMVMTIYAAMKAVDPHLLQAAEGMGSPGWYTFARVYLPMTMPGVISGSIIVFILATGFFVTPALMGGRGDVMIGMLIQTEVEINLNWGLAAVISIFALVFILLLYGIYYRVAHLGTLIGREDAP